jgi:hypothetical protein
MLTKNLGLVKLILVSTVPPTNLNMLWYDDNVGQKRHKYYDTVTSTWKTLNGTGSGTSGIFAKRGTINPAWFDVDNNLVIPHNLGREDIIVVIKDASKIENTTYPFQTIDVNNVKIFTGEVITGEYAILCF